MATRKIRTLGKTADVSRSSARKAARALWEEITASDAPPPKAKKILAGRTASGRHEIAFVVPEPSESKRTKKGRAKTATRRATSPSA